MAATKLQVGLVVGVLAAGGGAVVLLTRGTPAEESAAAIAAAAAPTPAPAPAPTPPPPAPDAAVPAAPPPGPEAVVGAPPTDARPLPPNYDPAELVANGANALQTFVAEPRDPVWAAEVERVIGKRMSGDLEHRMPEARGMGMTCHTLSCAIVVDAPAGKIGTALAITKLITLGPVTVDVPPTGDGKARWIFFTDRRMADARKFTEWYLGSRRRAFAAIKAGTAENPFPVPSAQLPDE